MQSNTLILRLEAVTPLFLGGAEQQPELRAPSVRGALRFWLRAALGSIVGTSDLTAVRDLESSVFGDTGLASPIIIRLRGALGTVGNFDLDRDPRGRQRRNGHNYLYYSTRLGGNRRVPFQPARPDLTLTLAAERHPARDGCSRRARARRSVPGSLVCQYGRLGGPSPEQGQAGSSRPGRRGR